MWQQSKLSLTSEAPGCPGQGNLSSHTAVLWKELEAGVLALTSGGTRGFSMKVLSRYQMAGPCFSSMSVRDRMLSMWSWGQMKGSCWASAPGNLHSHADCESGLEHGCHR